MGIEEEVKETTTGVRGTGPFSRKLPELRTVRHGQAAQGLGKLF